MRILVTGATGFIGHHVIDWLVQNRTNDEIVATSTSIEKARRFGWFNKVIYIPCDYFVDNLNYFEYFGKPDILIHMGWRSVYRHLPSTQLDENLPIEMRFLRNFIQNNIRKIVVMGSCQEYGDVSGCVTEKTITHPTNAYGVAKNTLCSYLEFSIKEKQIQWNWIRQFPLLGDGQNPNSFQGLLEKAVKENATQFPMIGGEQIRDFIPVDVAAEYICKIALQTSIDGIVNCCTGKPKSLKEFAEEYVAEKKSNICLKLGVYPYREYETMSQWGSTIHLNQVISAYGYSK